MSSYLYIHCLKPIFETVALKVYSVQLLPSNVNNDIDDLVCPSIIHERAVVGLDLYRATTAPLGPRLLNCRRQGHVLRADDIRLWDRHITSREVHRHVQARAALGYDPLGRLPLLCLGQHVVERDHALLLYGQGWYVVRALLIINLFFMNHRWDENPACAKYHIKRKRVCAYHYAVW